MNNQQRKTHRAVFSEPVRCDIEWSSIERLLKALGAEISEGRGSRVRAVLRGVKGTFHRPHPEKVTDKGAVKSVRDLLAAAGLDSIPSEDAEAGSSGS